MADEIRAEYDQLKQVATRFSNQEAMTREMINIVNRGMQPLESGSWIGRGSDAFFNEMNGEVMPAAQRLMQALAEASSVVQQIAQTVQAAEEDAAALFK